jgi:plasminogen activator inhibitor 1 RNA-binding protein
MSCLALTMDHSEHTKQVDQGWGAPTGDAEWNDEKAGDAIAATEVKEAGWDANAAAGVPGWDEGAAQGAPGFADSGAAPPADDGFGADTTGTEAAEPEPEDTSISYADYLAKQAEKKMEGLGLKEARKPNEGAKQDKKWQNAKAITRSEDEEYIQGAGEKARRERDRLRNAPKKVEVDLSWKTSTPDTRGGGRGGRGERRGSDRGGRGEYRGRGDGEFRGRGRGRGDGEYRGRGDGEYRGRGDGEYRGRGEGEYRGRGDGEYRGRGGRGGGRGRGGSDAQPVAVNDESAFPSLGK